jgi:hypothetical protein
VKNTLIHPLLNLVDINAAGPELRMDVEIHIQRRVPPPA